MMRGTAANDEVDCDGQEPRGERTEKVAPLGHAVLRDPRTQGHEQHAEQRQHRRPEHPRVHARPEGTGLAADRMEHQQGEHAEDRRTGDEPPDFALRQAPEHEDLHQIRVEDDEVQPSERHQQVLDEQTKTVWIPLVALERLERPRHEGQKAPSQEREDGEDPEPDVKLPLDMQVEQIRRRRRR
jgi:hypothetical protein